MHVPPASVRVILTHLISLLRAKEVFGHVLRQHVGDQRLVPPPHLKNLLLVVVHADLPQEQLPGLKLQLKKKEKKKRITLRSKHRLVRSVQMCLGRMVTHMTCKIIEANHHDYNHHSHEVFGWHDGSS